MIVCQSCGNLTLKVRLGAHFQKYCPPCKQKIKTELGLIGMRKYRRNHPERRPIIAAKNRERRLELSPEKREEERSHGIKVRLILKKEVISVYGGRCACCSESQFEFLSIDHINGGGTKHRKELPAGLSIWKWAKNNGFPPTLRILCFNCNCAIGFFGNCPHQDNRSA